MMKLTNSRNAWGSPGFADALKQELEALALDDLPLQQGLTQGSYAIDEPRRVMVISSSESGDAIHAVVGVFYSSMLGGCHCADDPSKAEALNEYCEVNISIQKESGEADASLVPE